MTWKDEYIAEHGQEAYDIKLEQNRERKKNNPEKYQEYAQDWRRRNAEEDKKSSREWRKENPVKAHRQHIKWRRKEGGKFYLKTLENNRNGIRGERTRIRSAHGHKWRPYKLIIAPESQIHHEWIPETSEYRGVALVEADQHMHGFIDVIKILEGEIKLFTENEVREFYGQG